MQKINTVDGETMKRNTTTFIIGFFAVGIQLKLKAKKKQQKTQNYFYHWLSVVDIQLKTKKKTQKRKVFTSYALI